MNFKVGDYVLFKHPTFLEHLNIIKIHTLNNGDYVYICLSVEALNERSKAFVGNINEFKTLSSGRYQLILITDEKEIIRLNKLLVFK